MKVGNKANSSIQPTEFELYQVDGNQWGVAYNTDIEEHTVTEDEQIYTLYTYVVRRSTSTITNYGELVSALVHLVYSFDDEIALNRKGVLNPDDEEYLAYILYVEICKEWAKTTIFTE